jgi:hypothetical protein
VGCRARKRLGACIAIRRVLNGKTCATVMGDVPGAAGCWRWVMVGDGTSGRSGDSRRPPPLDYSTARRTHPRPGSIALCDEGN